MANVNPLEDLKLNEILAFNIARSAYGIVERNSFAMKYLARRAYSIVEKNLAAIAIPRRGLTESI